MDGPARVGLIAHADWGSQAGKRQMAVARRRERGGWQAFPTVPVDSPGRLLRDLAGEAGPGSCVLVGFDFPIGLPRRYAEQCGVRDFLALLPELGRGVWSDFYKPAAQPEEISLYRPFYPSRAGSSRQAHLLQALGVERMDDLRRACDLPRPGRRAACPLFWTLGGQQVGKAAISGWSQVLSPGLAQGALFPLNLRVWPFDGPLLDLLEPNALVVAETYPAEVYDHLGVDLRRTVSAPGDTLSRLTRGKRSPSARLSQAPVLLEWARRAGVALQPGLEAQIRSGFGPSASGDDAFDALIGLFGLINIVLGRRPAGEPSDQAVRKIEGWIAGMEPRPPAGEESS